MNDAWGNHDFLRRAIGSCTICEARNATIHCATCGRHVCPECSHDWECLHCCGGWAAYHEPRYVRAYDWSDDDDDDDL